MTVIDIRNTAVIGAAGAGKGLMLNNLVKETVFESGLSVGTGRTTKCQVHTQANGDSWVDAPGLNDIAMRKECAVEIKKALSRGGLYRLIVVISLANGRLTGETVETVQRVWDAMPAGFPVGVIVNQVVGNMDDVPYDSIVKQLFVDRDVAHVHWCAIPYTEAWEEEENVMGDEELQRTLENFVNTIPFTRLDADEVGPINDKTVEELEEEAAKAVAAKAAKMEKKDRELEEAARREKAEQDRREAADLEKKRKEEKATEQERQVKAQAKKAAAAKAQQKLASTNAQTAKKAQLNTNIEEAAKPPPPIIEVIYQRQKPRKRWYKF